MIFIGVCLMCLDNYMFAYESICVFKCKLCVVHTVYACIICFSPPWPRRAFETAAGKKQHN